MKPADDREEVLFREALPMAEGPEREAFLDQACAGNAALRARLAAFLQAHESSDPFLEPPAGDSRPESGAPPPQRTTVLSAPVTEKPGDKIGHYKLLQQIGEGGCGVVYMAEQEEPIRRRVAFKAIKLGMDTKQVVARFEAERQALALMDHANIAKVLDAGATETGRPYFVMELVRGIKITDYCDQNNLSTEERLNLFAQICHAIQHAHQKGIIHRDIKPSNILVTLHDGAPVPKVIDFGIAKATGGQVLTDKTLFTAFEQFIGTPAYMSPEQAEMSGLDIDTRSDIYALGVLLYELLTGQTPFDQKELVAAGLDGMRRIIREKEPVRPSTRLSTLDDAERTTVAKRRHTEAPQLVHLVRGDLDWIVMKCLEKDRTRRYETAKDLAADVRRHLENAPVQARPPDLWYLTQKFLRRRKQYIVAGGLCCALLVAALLAGLQYKRTQTLRKSAQIALFREEESQVITEFIAKTPVSEAAIMRFKACLARLADRVSKGGGSKADWELLARVINVRVRLDGPSIQKIQEPDVMFVVGLGRCDVEGLGAVVVPTITVGNSELQVGSSEMGNDDFPLYMDGSGRENMVSSVHFPIQLRGVISQTGKYRISGILTVQLVKARRDKERSNRHVKLTDYDPVGFPVRLLLPPLDCTFVEEVPSHYPVELADARLSEKIREGIAVPDAWIDLDPDKQGRLHLELSYPYSKDSEPSFPIALDWKLTHLDGVAVNVKPLSTGGGFSAGTTVETLDLALPDGMAFQSEPRSVIKGRVSVRSSREIALAQRQDQFLAIPEIQKEISIELRRNGSGELSPWSEWMQGTELVSLGKLADAESLYRERLRSLRTLMSADDPVLARTVADLAYTMLCEQKFTEAESLARECLAIEEKQMPDNWRAFAARSLLGATLLGQRRYDEAEPLLLSGYDGIKQRVNWIHPNLKTIKLALALVNLVHLYTAIGQADHAVEQCRKAAESADAQPLNDLAWFLATRRNPQERDGKIATILAEKAAAMTQRKEANILDTLAAAYAEAGEFAKAVTTQQEAIALLGHDVEKKDFNSRLHLYQSQSRYREPE